MESTIQLTEDIFNELKIRSEKRGIEPEELAIEILEDELYYTEEEDKIFEQRTRDAIEQIENDSDRKIMTKEEFLKELDSW